MSRQITVHKKEINLAKVTLTPTRLEIKLPLSVTDKALPFYEELASFIDKNNVVTESYRGRLDISQRYCVVKNNNKEKIITIDLLSIVGDIVNNDLTTGFTNSKIGMDMETMEKLVDMIAATKNKNE